MTDTSEPQLLTTKEAARLLRVSPRTVLNWIDQDAIPYVALPSAGGRRREYRIPRHGLLRSLAANYDLAQDFAAADAALARFDAPDPTVQERSDHAQRRRAVAH
jgi:excisionase family DNA binding protein